MVTEAVDGPQDLAPGCFSRQACVGGDVAAFFDKLSIDRFGGGHVSILPVTPTIRPAKIS